MECLFCTASCIMYMTSAWSKTCSIEHCLFAWAWFSAHPGCSISRQHVTSTQGSDWLLSKPTFLRHMAGWGHILNGSKNNGLNQPNARESYTMYYTYHTKTCRITWLQANSCDNLSKGYCKLGQVQVDCRGRERTNSYAPTVTRALCNMS